MAIRGGGGNGSSFTPFIKFNAKDGSFLRRDSFKDANDQWQVDEVDITEGFAAAIDLANVRVGWLDFSSGAPDKRLVFNKEIGVDGVEYPAQPGNKHKEGFEVCLILGKDSRGDDDDDYSVKQWSSNSSLVVSAYSDLDDAFLAGIEEDPSRKEKFPIVKLAEIEEVKTNFGTFKKPRFEIVGWLEDAGQSESFGKVYEAGDGDNGPAPQSGDSGPSAGGGMGAGDDGLPFAPAF